MAKQQKYGICFPFNIKSMEKTFVDLNDNPVDGVKSQIMHLIFTPVGQRLRKPLFGTSLLQFIFNPNDQQSWSDVVMEIKEKVSANVQGCKIDDVTVYEGDNGLSLYTTIKYTLTDRTGTATQGEIMTKLT